MTGDIETAVHYRYMEPLLATGRIPNSGEVAERLGVPVERVRCALRSLADSHGVVLHTHVCEPWVIHPFSASPTATWVESGNRPFRVAAAERLGLRPPFLRDRPAVPQSRGRPDLVRPPRHSDGGRGADSPGHGSRKGVVRAPRLSGLAKMDRARSRRDFPQSRARRRFLGNSHNRRRFLICP